MRALTSELYQNPSHEEKCTSNRSAIHKTTRTRNIHPPYRGRPHFQIEKTGKTHPQWQKINKQVGQREMKIYVARKGAKKEKQTKRNPETKKNPYVSTYSVYIGDTADHDCARLIN